MSRATMTDEQRYNASLGHHLGRLIDSSGIPVRDYARRANIPERRLRMILTGAAEHVYLRDLVKLCDVAGTKPSAFLDGARM